MKVRKLTKHECSTKITSLITQHEKKLLFNCSSRVYQGLMKLNFRANWYLSLFTCNTLMCRYKNQTHISNFCQFKLSTDIEKNPGPVVFRFVSVCQAILFAPAGFWPRGARRHHCTPRVDRSTLEEVLTV